MYSISLTDKLAQMMPVDQRHFFAASFPSSNNTIHFSYNLLSLQKEIEKRTFYLGKYRKSEEAQHLMDLIGMSRDEGDLLYPFVKAAMADVYDNLNLHTTHITKLYEWKEPSDAIVIAKIPQLNELQSSSINVAELPDGRSIVVSGTITDGGLKNGGNVDTSIYRIATRATVEVTTKYGIIGTDVVIQQKKTINFDIPSEYLRSLGNNQWQIVPFSIPVPLDAQSNMITEETIANIGTVSLEQGTMVLEEINPTFLPEGTIIKVDDITYEITEDTDSTKLKLNKQAKQVDPNETLVEGIHYYLSVPNYINLSSLAPLDTAIMEALVNRIIWKWLVLSYPAEAATYDTLYQDNLKSIALRCNIFNKHWQKVPRIF
jgi:hypothetical protein